MWLRIREWVTRKSPLVTTHGIFLQYVQELVSGYFTDWHVEFTMRAQTSYLTIVPITGSSWMNLACCRASVCLLNGVLYPLLQKQHSPRLVDFEIYLLRLRLVKLYRVSRSFYLDISNCAVVTRLKEWCLGRWWSVFAVQIYCLLTKALLLSGMKGVSGTYESCDKATYL